MVLHTHIHTYTHTVHKARPRTSAILFLNDPPLLQPPPLCGRFLNHLDFSLIASDRDSKIKIAQRWKKFTSHSCLKNPDLAVPLVEEYTNS